MPHSDRRSCRYTWNSTATPNRISCWLCSLSSEAEKQSCIAQSVSSLECRICQRCLMMPSGHTVQEMLSHSLWKLVKSSSSILLSLFQVILRRLVVMPRRVAARLTKCLGKVLQVPGAQYSRAPIHRRSRMIHQRSHRDVENWRRRSVS